MNSLSRKQLSLLHAEASSISGYKTTDTQALDQGFSEEIEDTEEIAKEFTKRTDTLTEDQIKDLFGLLDEATVIQKYGNNRISAIQKAFIDQINGIVDPLESRNPTSEIIRESKREIVEKALEFVAKKFACQSVAIFLISKRGRLQRLGIRGWDENGIEVEKNWFSDESYELDNSFTGRAAQPRPGSRYGQVQVAEILANSDLDLTSRKEYESKFGDLRCAIAIPLNGRNKTYGVLRVINKVDITTIDGSEHRELSSEFFSTEDIALLLSLSTYVSSALSNFRRDIQSDILEYLSRLLIRYPYGNHQNPGDLKTICQEFVDLLVGNPENSFQACVLRMKNKDGVFECQAWSASTELIGERDNSPRKFQDNSVVWAIANRGKRVIIPDLQGSPLLDQFHNKKWITDNKLMSFACFPLVEKGDVLGTLSVYIGYKYKFYSDSIRFLQGITDLLALFFLKVQQEQQYLDIQSLDPSPQAQIDSVSQGEQIKSKFNNLATTWKDETRTFPILLDRFIHPTYQNIIGLGKEVVPLLIEELMSDKPDYWFWALEAIVGDTPVRSEQDGRIQEMINAWVKWGKDHGYVHNI
jgi:GAF domain-containing protein